MPNITLFLFKGNKQAVRIKLTDSHELSINVTKQS